MATRTKIVFNSAGFAAILKSQGTHDVLASQGERVRSGVDVCETHQRSVHGRSDGRWLEIVGTDPKTPVEAYESRRQLEAAI